MQSLRVLPAALIFIFLCSSFLIYDQDRLSSNEEFEQMLALFPDANLPAEFDAATIFSERKRDKNYKANRIKSDLIEKFIPLPEGSHFSRSGPPVMKPLMKFEATENIYALIFENRTRYGGNSIECATIDKKGNLNNRMYLIRRSPESFASIDKEGLIEVHSMSWYAKQKGEKAKINFFKITDDGNFKDFTEYVTSARASLD